MPRALKIEFGSLHVSPVDVLVLFCEEGVKLGAAGRRLVEPIAPQIKRAASAERFKGKNGSALEIIAPAGIDVSRLIIIGVGKARDLRPHEFVKLGGTVMGRIPAGADAVTLIADLPGRALQAERVADLALGMQLRAYSFDRYKTKRGEEEEPESEIKVTIASANTGAARKAWGPHAAEAAGVCLARDLVNEPANVLYPE